MKPKTMILMGLAITCGLGASYMTSRLLADRQTEEKETAEVLVAKKNLNIGERLDKPEELFEKKTILKEHETPDLIRDHESLRGKILKQSRNKGDTIAPNNLYGKGENLDIPDGHQAVGLKVNLETSVSGLATLPGSRVNLIWFQRGEKNETSRVDVLLQDIFVLAADGKVERDGITAVAQVVTLALTPEQVNFVNLAKETGVVNLALRKSGDKSTPVAGITGADLRKLVQGQKTSEEPEAPKVAAKPADGAPNPAVKVETPRSSFLTIINGSRQQNFEIRPDDSQRTPETPRPQGPVRPENPQQDT
jgi:Flp pilus assembly protein CpaB